MRKDWNCQTCSAISSGAAVKRAPSTLTSANNKSKGAHSNFQTTGCLQLGSASMILMLFFLLTTKSREIKARMVVPVLREKSRRCLLLSPCCDLARCSYAIGESRGGLRKRDCVWYILWKLNRAQALCRKGIRFYSVACVFMLAQHDRVTTASMKTDTPSTTVGL